MEYVVEVVPPTAGEAVFEVGGYDYGSACTLARRYRERGWRAAVAGAEDAPRRWRVWDPGSGMPPQVVLARSCDCALAQGRRLQPGACAVQAAPVEGGEY